MWGFKQILHLSCSSRLKLRNQAHVRLHLKPQLFQKIFLVSLLFKLFTSLYFFQFTFVFVCLSCSYGVFPQAFARKCAVTGGDFRRQTKTLLCGKFAHCFSYLSICTSFARSWKCNLNDVLRVTSARHHSVKGVVM